VSKFRLGFDLGGTKIEIMALGNDGKYLLRTRKPTPRENYPALLDTIASMVNDAEATLGGRGTVGIGIPGSISPATGLARNANSTWINNTPLQQDLEARLGRPVRLANDANCFALSEAVDGAAAGAPIVFGAILGTGVGGGIVIDGRALVGANAIAGEWGHTPLPGLDLETGPVRHCWCGRRACIESYLSGPALARDYAAGGGATVDGETVAKRAAAGEAAAQAALDRYMDRLARALATIVNILDPHVIVLGGGLSNIDALYDGVPKRWTAQVFSDRIATRLAKNKHGDSSGVRGAAWLWPIPDGA
jgi:fructokinase